MSLNRLNTKSANVLENPLKKIYYYEITKLIGMKHTYFGQLWAIHKTYARILVTGFGIELSEFLALHSKKQSKYVECARNL
jgi:hypothetical protein